MDFTLPPTSPTNPKSNILFGSLSNSEVPYKPLLDYYFPPDSAKIVQKMSLIYRWWSAANLEVQNIQNDFLLVSVFSIEKQVETSKIRH